LTLINHTSNGSFPLSEHSTRMSSKKKATPAKSREEKLAKAPLRYDFKDAFFYTKKTVPKPPRHLIGTVKLKKVHDASKVDPKGATLLNTGTLQWFSYQSENIKELKGKTFDDETLANVATINRFFLTVVRIDEERSDIAKATVAITSERTDAFKQANKAWKVLKRKCQECVDAGTGIEPPLVGFKDAHRDNPGALGRHLKVIDKFFLQYKKFLKYRGKWKLKLTKKKAASPPPKALKPQLTFNAENESDSSGIEGDDSDSDEAEVETTKDSAKKSKKSAKSDKESESSDSDSSESSEEGAAKEPPKAAAKSSAQMSDSDSSDSSEEDVAKSPPKAAAKASAQESDSDSSEAEEYELADGTTVYVDSSWNAYNEAGEKLGVVNPKTKTLKRTWAAARKAKDAAEARVKKSFVSHPDGKKQAQLVEDAKVVARKEEIDMLKKRKFKKSGNQNEFARLYKRGFTADQVQEIMEAQKANGYYSEGDPSLDDSSTDSDADARQTLLKETGQKKPAARRTPKSKTHLTPKRTHEQVNKRSSNKKKKRNRATEPSEKYHKDRSRESNEKKREKRRKKNKKSKGSPSAATP